MTTRRQWIASSAAASLLRAADSPIDLGSRRELFVDRFLIDTLHGADFRLHAPRREADALAVDRPWEGRFSNYVTVLHHGGRFHLYYRGLPAAGKDGSPAESTCYAVSNDGRAFTRPNLGLFELHGSRANNAILAGMPPFSSNFSPVIDTRPGVPESQKFKALAGTRSSGLAAFQSADGIRWSKMRQEPVFRAGVFDSQNLAFWSDAEQRYVMYFRTFKRVGSVGYRWISRTTSDDFLNWAEPVEMSFGDAPPEHLYTNQTHPYFRAPHIYIALAARFMPGRQVLSEEEARSLGVDPGYYKDCADSVLLTSRGGATYDRTFLEAFVRPGPGLENWVSRNNYPALNTVQTGPEELSFYTLANYGQPTAHVRRYSLPLDRFASIHAGYRGGEAVTKPLRFAGARLLLNFATSAPGGVRVEVQDASGAALPGFRLDDCVELIGDQIERAVRWKAASLESVVGKTVRLRIAMKDADVYALRFG
jgi:hypothetical protein